MRQRDVTEAALSAASRGTPVSFFERDRIAARWTFAPRPQPELVQALADELRLPEAICSLLVLRGHQSAAAAAKFLRPRLSELHDGAGMLGMSAAVDRLEQAIRLGERILVHGDYDVDGICSAALLTIVLRELGAQVTPFVPRRLEDGYDLGAAGVRAAVSAGASVVVTCDCGTSAWEAVAGLKEAGVDTIITDHHLPPPAGVPAALAVINPRQAGCTYPDKDLAGVGVAFKLAQQLAKRLGASEGIVFAHLDLVALATVADVAPLRGENRALARAGLKLIGETKKAGLRALLRSAGISDKPITAGRIGFILAPRLNAVGRLGTAMRGVELLLSQSEADANVIARELEEFNRTRQEIDRATLAAAREMLSRLTHEEACGIVLASEDWHPGVVGIVASRIVEETGRPTVLIAIADGVGKGSGRSIAAFDLHSGLGECADLFMRFGGHRAAAGVTMRPELVGEFARRFNEIVKLQVHPDDFLPQLRIDLEIDFPSWDLESVEKLLRHFEPFGPSNPGPVFAALDVEVSRPPRKVGESGVRFSVRSGSRDLDVLSWTHYPRKDEIVAGKRMDIAFRLERDEWHGADRLQGRLLDFRSP